MLAISSTQFSCNDPEFMENQVFKDILYGQHEKDCEPKLWPGSYYPHGNGRWLDGRNRSKAMASA